LVVSLFNLLPGQQFEILRKEWIYNDVNSPRQNCSATQRFIFLLCLSLTLAAMAACSSSGSSSTNTATTPVVTSITLSPTAVTIGVGSPKQFSATANYSDQSTKDVTGSAAWTSSDATVASVESTGQSSPGLATGVKAGSVTITASFSGQSASTTLAVSLRVVTSLTIAPTNASLTVGKTMQFVATALYNDGTIAIVTTSAAWSSSDSTVAPIQSTGQNSPGLATAAAPGNVNITATFNGVSAVTILNIIGNGTLSSFFISQIDASIAPAATLQLFGYAEYSDGSVNWVTASTHWTSSTPSVAAIEDQGQTSAGLVTAAATGTTRITATFGGLTASTNLTVAANAVPIDLMDMTSSQNYLNFEGGLYENSSDVVPAAHDTNGLAAGAAVQALDQNGNPSSSGAIVFLGIGMSNATEEFSAFASTASATSGVNHATLAIEDGATGAATACYWTVETGPTLASCPDAKGVLLDNQYDRVRDTVLATATTAPSAPQGCGGPPNPTPCLTEEQVQVLWIKNANPRPGIANERTLCDATISGCVNDSGTEAILYEQQLGETIRAAKSRYPNLKQVFLSSRIYAGYATDGLNPEPYAYEYGYSAKWLIEAQVVQERGGAPDPVAGDMSITDGAAAWTAWGAYLWADGTIARSDGLTWLSSDFQSDGTHPDAQGTTKVVNLLMGFYTTSTYTPWFRP
jgi:hypothetical protein